MDTQTAQKHNPFGS